MSGPIGSPEALPLKSRGRAYRGIAAALVFGTVTALASAELALRVWALVSPSFADQMNQTDLLAIQIEPMGINGYRQRPNGAFHYPGGVIITSNVLGYRGPVVAVPKPPQTLRVILLGGSGTHGWGVHDAETIDAYLRAGLAKRYPGRSVEVVNLAFDGYDSYQNYERLRVDGIRLEPDVIIVNAGTNDVRNARFQDLKDPDPRTMLWLSIIQIVRTQQARGHPTLSAQVKHYLYVARLASIARQALSTTLKAESGPIHPNLGAVDYFERNLRRTAALAAEHGAALLLSPEPSGIPGNLGPDAVSHRYYWITNARVTQDLRDHFATRMEAVADDLRKQRQRVTLVPHHLAPTMFLDEAHLTPAGNATMAADFEEAIVALLRQPGQATPKATR